MQNILELSRILKRLKSAEEIYDLLTELLTPAELDTLSKRWRILKLLAQDVTQRDIAHQLNVSLCKVTRGAKILKNQNAIVKKYLKGAKK